MALDTAKAITSLNILSQKFDFGAGAYETFYPEVCTIVPSNRASEDYGWLGATPGVREWIGDRMLQQLRGARFNIVNRMWEDSILIDKTDIEDDRLGIYANLFEALGKEAAKHPDELLFQTIAAGDTQRCFDGNFFFDTVHTGAIAGGPPAAQSNKITAPALAGTTMTAAEWQLQFETALQTMMAYVNDQNKLLHRPVVSAQPNLMALVPLSMWKPALTAVTAGLIGGGNTNVNISPVSVRVSPYLTAKRWVLMHTGGPVKPFIFQARRPIGRQFRGLEDRMYKDVQLLADARYNVGYGPWWEAILTITP